MKEETSQKYTVVMRVLNCGRNSENRKGAREMLEMNITGRLNKPWLPIGCMIGEEKKFEPIVISTLSNQKVPLSGTKTENSFREKAMG